MNNSNNISKNNSPIESGKETINQAIAGLKSLEANLDDSFINTVNLVHGLKGRLIISGMGKSGHIGKKIAATLASTGTPAFFVHPAEASHGDLGMIAEGDAVLMLSNSGETKELEDIIIYCKRFSIPIIALVRRAESMLVEAADIAHILPDISEASIVKAPTTSTTMMLVFGDALAMALLAKNGFGKQDFSTYHPGGKLGKGLLKVEKLMHVGDEIPLIVANATMSDAIVAMTSKSFGCVGVTANNTDKTIIGVVTDGDLRRHINDDIMSKTIAEVMTKSPIMINQNILAVEAVNIMNSKKITSLFVVSDDKKPLGILHLHDCLRAGIV